MISFKAALIFGARAQVVVDDYDPVLAHGDSYVSAGALQHVDVSGYFGGFDLDFAEILLSRAAPSKTPAARPKAANSVRGTKGSHDGVLRISVDGVAANIITCELIASDRNLEWKSGGRDGVLE